MVERGIVALGVDLARPDFVAMARAMGCHALTVTVAAEAAAEAAKALAAVGQPRSIWLSRANLTRPRRLSDPHVRIEGC
jgi:thiamine pyrophosphate-dependent acetolactate synthase large subunit-like protein